MPNTAFSPILVRVTHRVAPAALIAYEVLGDLPSKELQDTVTPPDPEHPREGFHNLVSPVWGLAVYGKRGTPGALDSWKGVRGDFRNRRVTQGLFSPEQVRPVRRGVSTGE